MKPADNSRVHPPSFRRYRRVAIAAWDCLVSAGDAPAAWLACSQQRHALSYTADYGWHGVPPLVGTTSLLDVAERAARRPFAALRDPHHDFALIASSSKGDPHAWSRALAGSPESLLAALPGQLSGRLASRLGIACYRGAPVAAACATGLYSVLDAADMMEHQQCISALAGAADTGLTPMLHAGFRSLKVLCGESLPQAFAQATGFAPALGAGFLALDREGPWILRGGIRYGDAGHQTRYTDPRTLRGALEALWSILPEPNLICTHGTGTVTGDAYERAALDQGPWARVERIHCKPFIGHCLGASGTAELALALEAPVRRLWKLSLGFGGHLAAVAAERS